MFCAAKKREEKSDVLGLSMVYAGVPKLRQDSSVIALVQIATWLIKAPDGDKFPALGR